MSGSSILHQRKFTIMPQYPLVQRVQFLLSTIHRRRKKKGKLKRKLNSLYYKQKQVITRWNPKVQICPVLDSSSFVLIPCLPAELACILFSVVGLGMYIIYYLWRQGHTYTLNFMLPINALLMGPKKNYQSKFWQIFLVLLTSCFSHHWHQHPTLLENEREKEWDRNKDKFPDLNAFI